MTKRIRHIDMAGLPKGFDIADLVAQGVAGEQLLNWFRARVRDGNYAPVKRRAKPKLEGVPSSKPKPKPKDPPPAKKAERAPAPPSNVVPLKKPEEELGLPPEYSEDALAEGFSEEHENSLIYVSAWDSWLIWEQARWTPDETHAVLDLARRTCKKYANEALGRADLGGKAQQIATKIAQRKTFGNVEAIARTDRRHAAVPAQFDADPWILNTPAGVVELKTGAVRPARRSDYAAKVTAVGPDADCPNWLAFLETATDGDTALQEYLARVAGYCLTGSVCEHVFFFVWGTGGNGKGTFLNTLDWILNSYARVANMDTFTEQRFSKHASEIAYFQGARMVTAQETEEGKRWNESRIKAMTGGDPITANFMHKNPFTFRPSFKLLFAGNHKPALRNIDEAIKRRMHLIPFNVTVPPKDRDPGLPDKLRAEAGGILGWAIQGCLDWQERLLSPPARVLATTEEYFETEDTIGNFFGDCCNEGPFLRVRTTDLYQTYSNWAKRAGEYTLSRKRFLDVLRLRDLHSEKKGGEQVVIGIELRASEADRARYPEDWWNR